MILSTELLARSGGKCELCNNEATLHTFIVSPKVGSIVDEQVALCSVCLEELANPENLNPDHWRCLNESMWSTVPAVQVLAYRTLKNLNSNEWAQDWISMIYLDETTQEWADATGVEYQSEVVHKDSNGQILLAGDNVVLIKDLDVKGANFIAKRGTAVRRITLVKDNPEQIEGRVNDQHIVILTKFVKKSI